MVATVMEITRPMAMAPDLLRMAACAIAGVASFAIGQGAQAQVWHLTPTIAARITYSDNVDLSPRNLERADTFAEFVPGLRLNHRGARLNADLDYQLKVLRYLDLSERNDQQNSLNASATLEAIERWMFVDARAEIRQQAASAFGPQLLAGSGNVSDRRETRNFLISPYVQGLLPSDIEYEARAALQAVSASEDVSRQVGEVSSLGSYRVYGATGHLRGRTGFAGLGWTADASAQSVDYSGTGRSVAWQAVRTFAVYEVRPQLHVKAAVGWEYNDVESENGDSSSLFAYGLDWAPSERTKLSILREKRFFGTGHTVRLTHRGARSAWNYIDAKDISAGIGGALNSGIGSTLDLLGAALTARMPDPLEREQEARRMLGESGIGPAFGTPPSINTNRVFVDRRRNLGVTWFSPRDTIALAVFLSDRSLVGGGTGQFDDFSLTDKIRQRGFNGTWSHRLTPLATMSMAGQMIRAKGSGTNPIQSDDRSLSLSVATRLGIKSSGTVGLTHRRFDGEDGQAGRENTVFVSMAHQF